jgi:hypothetical protein
VKVREKTWSALETRWVFFGAPVFDNPSDREGTAP